MHVDRLNQYQQKNPRDQNKARWEKAAFYRRTKENILIRWAIFICRKEMRLISIVDYQINSLWINQTHKHLGKVENKGSKTDKGQWREK